MGLTSSLRTVGALLGQPLDRPVTARKFRNTAITVHTLEPSAPWVWEPQPAVGDEVAMVALAHDAVRVEWEPDASEKSSAVLLHPHRFTRVSAHEQTSVMCVWVPWDALEEVADSISCAPVLAKTPLVVGLRGFVRAMVARSSTATIYTDYLVEKLLAEMVFGVVLETGSGADALARESAARQQRPIDRARTLMLLRRTDPAFNVEDLARELHMSTRQLQRAFSAEGSSPADELRRLRAEHARDLLADEAYAMLTVEEVATHSGFGTSAALRRAFSALGMPSPRRQG